MTTMDYLTKCSIDEIRNLVDRKSESDELYEKRRQEIENARLNAFDKERLNGILSEFLRLGKRSLSISYPNSKVNSINRLASLAIQHKLNAEVRVVNDIVILDIDCF